MMMASKELSGGRNTNENPPTRWGDTGKAEHIRLNRPGLYTCPTKKGLRLNELEIEGPGYVNSAQKNNTTFVVGLTRDETASFRRIHGSFSGKRISMPNEEGERRYFSQRRRWIKQSSSPSRISTKPRILRKHMDDPRVENETELSEVKGGRERAGSIE